MAAMEGGGDGGLCLSQKLSQVSLRSAPHRAHPHLDQILCSLAEDDLDDICSQDFFCTPDFLTPVEQQFTVDFEGNKENAGPFPASLQCSPVRTKRPRPDAGILQQSLISLKDNHPGTQLEHPLDDLNYVPTTELDAQIKLRPHADYVPPNSRARIASMRRRVLSPPCLKNPFKREEHEDCIVKGKVPPKQGSLLTLSQ